MFWKKRKDPAAQKAEDDKARVELIRERLSDYKSTGEKTEFDITEPLKDEDDRTINKDGTIEFDPNVQFTKYDPARVNYDVQEYEDITVVPTDARRALKELMADSTAFQDDTTDPDYWSTTRTNIK